MGKMEPPAFCPVLGWMDAGAAAVGGGGRDSLLRPVPLACQGPAAWPTWPLSVGRHGADRLSSGGWWPAAGPCERGAIAAVTVARAALVCGSRPRPSLELGIGTVSAEDTPPPPHDIARHGTTRHDTARHSVTQRERQTRTVLDRRLTGGLSTRSTGPPSYYRSRADDWPSDPVLGYTCAGLQAQDTCTETAEPVGCVERS